MGGEVWLTQTSCVRTGRCDARFLQGIDGRLEATVVTAVGAVVVAAIGVLAHGTGQARFRLLTVERLPLSHGAIVHQTWTDSNAYE